MSYTLTYANGGLPAAADYIRSKGRNEDTQLVHMTPGEVDALQNLAEQHGGSLTINPQTGLPEAGFLGNVLSVAAPIALSVAFPGAGTAIGSSLGLGTGALSAGVGMGLMTGGLTALMTGDIKKGLTAGATSGLIGGAMSGMGGAAVDPTAVKTPVAAQSMMQNASVVAPNAAKTAAFESSMGLSPAYAAGAGAKVVPTASPGLLDRASNWWNNDLTSNQRLGVGLGGVAALGVLGSMDQPKLKGEPIDKGTIRPYKYSSSIAQPASGKSVFERGPMYDEAGNPFLDKEERNYFTQGFTAQPTYKAAAGGLMQGDMYPQSQQVNTEFANPIQAPTSAEVVGQYEPSTLPFSGEPVRMAGGGGAAEATQQEALQSALNNKYTYDPAKQQYTKVDPPPPPPMPQQSINNNYPFSFMGNFGGPMAGNPWITGNNMNMRGTNNAFGNQGMGGIGGMMGMLRGLEQQAAVPVPSYQYTYDPVKQQYTQLAEGGNVSEGYRGYGQGNNMPMPINLMALMSPPKDTQPQQTVEVVRKAAGGLSNLGGYSDGGQLLKGPGDGVSDDIPAQIGAKQPARLADGEFVIPARIVSELGNGSTDAGAKRLYAWMDSMQEIRKKTVGEDDVAKDTKAYKTLPT